MNATPTAEQLRERATGLRALARRLQQLRVLSLHHDAGPDTWLGPSPHRCVDAMRAIRAALLADADDLLYRAHRFERAAAELDALPKALPTAR